MHKPGGKTKGSSKGRIFPPIERADAEGILAVSRDLNEEMLLEAYSSGIFPWPFDNSCVLWFAPQTRAVLDFAEFKASKKLMRELRSKNFTLEHDRRFKAVIENCASQPRPGQEGTWITPKIINAYCQLHRCGLARSFETIGPDGELAGGLYGVQIGHYFSGESMFHKSSDASKFALVGLVEFLKEQGLTWLDAQVMTPLLASFGAKEISRDEYMRRLKSDCFIPQN